MLFSLHGDAAEDVNNKVAKKMHMKKFLALIIHISPLLY